MADALKAFAASTIATAPSPAASGISLVVAAGHGARFPEVPFNVTVCPADADADITNSEILRVTNASTDTFTVLRAQEGTSARTIIVGDRIFQGVTPKMIEDREPVQTAASQAEAEAGSVTAIRSFTPERIKQAIIALGLNTGLASTVSRTTLSGTAVDITAKESVKSLTGDATLTFSGTPGTGQEFRLTLNADSTARTVTLPADIYSIQRQGVVGSVVVPASGTLLLGFRYTGARWEMLGDPAATVGSGSYLLVDDNSPAANDVATWDGSKAVWSPAAGGGTLTYAKFVPIENHPPAANYATLDTRGSTYPVLVLDFDKTTDESAVFVGVMPEAADLSGGVDVIIHFATDTTDNTKKVAWGVQFARLNAGNQDLDGITFDAATTGSTTVNATSGKTSTLTVAVAVADTDAIVAGDPFALLIYRDADDGTNDTVDGDANLLCVEIRKHT